MVIRGISKSLSQRVYDELLARLQSGRLVPGDLLNRRQVAQELRVSVAPVLEAMLRLERDGFLQTLPRKGTQVRLVRSDDVRGQLIVREALECQAARMYCGAPVRRNEKALSRLAADVDSAKRGTLEQWDSEIRFHRALVELTRCAALAATFDQVVRLSLFFAFNHVIEPPIRLAVDSHANLILRLVTDDPDEAEQIMRTHLRHGKGDLFDTPEPRAKVAR